MHVDATAARGVISVWGCNPAAQMVLPVSRGRDSTASKLLYKEKLKAKRDFSNVR